MAQRNTARRLMTIGTRLYTWWRGEPVGEDAFGNRYFRDKRGGRRRWVLFRGMTEATKVPPEWHAWLHHTVAAVPTNGAGRPWEKPHVPNLTGTAMAYKPAGAVDHGGHRAAATGDYEPWRPA
ncbi:MAG TPA: NADH:ubiquinone oxidoreductase subunit NDUFA12 [Candidatus Sulfotelmatobacter sp.]|nr:NADH:ubiquinone oxidoreductase subunit NDUFA12 [Candidatus Sulfotelmatobacter sp.]